MWEFGCSWKVPAFGTLLCGFGGFGRVSSVTVCGCGGVLIMIGPWAACAADGSLIGTVTGAGPCGSASNLP